MTIKRVFAGLYLFTESLDVIVEKFKQRAAHRAYTNDLIDFLCSRDAPEPEREQLRAKLLESGRIANKQQEAEALASGDEATWTRLFASMFRQHP